VYFYDFAVFSGLQVAALQKQIERLQLDNKTVMVIFALTVVFQAFASLGIVHYIKRSRRASVSECVLSVFVVWCLL
jgi:hypothetical protein